MTLHGALSIILTIKPGMKTELKELLKKMDEDVNTNPVIPFHKMESIHFARFVVLDIRPEIKGKEIKDCLAFTSNYDQPFDKHLDEMVTHAGLGFWQVFSHCVEFPAGNFDPETLKRFFITKNKKAETFYVGSGNRSVNQIRRENELRNQIENFLDTNVEEFKSKSSSEIRQEIIKFVNNNANLNWAKTPEPKAGFAHYFKHYLKLVMALLIFIALLPIVIPFIIIWMIFFLIMEINEKDLKPKADKTHIRNLLDCETGVVQNQFSAFGNVKAGKMRNLTMMFLLRLTNFLAPYLFSKGRLSGIPTVHFARWLIISEGRQMLFLSNYDGNSEGYLRDFINIAGRQLTLMFTHTEGYPKTRLMVLGGAKDAKGFMDWARHNQIITDVWYSANPTLSVKNIYQNSAIREGLYGDLNPKQTREWLQLF